MGIKTSAHRHLRAWYIGCALAFQASEASSILAARAITVLSSTWLGCLIFTQANGVRIPAGLPDTGASPSWPKAPDFDSGISQVRILPRLPRPGVAQW